MRVLIVVLLVFGAVGAVFYETNRVAPRQYRIKAMQAISRRPDVDEARRNEGEKDDDARLASEIDAGGRSAVDSMTSDNLPAFTPSASDRAANPTIEQLKRSRQALEASLLHEQGETRKASGDLTTARRDLEAALKDRSALSARNSELGAENSRLRSSISAAADEAARNQRHLADSADKSAAAAGFDHATLVKQIDSLNDKADQAGAQARQAEARLQQSESRASELQAKLAELGTTTQHIRDELASRTAAANQQSSSVARLTKELHDAETQVRDIGAGRAAANARVTQLIAQNGFVSTSLRTEKLALASASARSASEQRATDMARSARTAEFRKQSADAQARIGEMEKTLAHAAALETTLKAQLQDSESRQATTRLALLKAQAVNVRLATQIHVAASASGKRLADLRAQDATLAARVPKLTDSVDTLGTLVKEGDKQRSDLEHLLATLRAENRKQLAQIETLQKEQASQARISQDRIESRSKNTDGTRADKLTAALASVQAELAQTIRDKVSADHARNVAETALAARDATLQSEHEQNALRAADMSKRLETERNKAKELDMAFASAKAQLAQVQRAASEARLSSEKSLEDVGTQLRGERQQTAALNAKLAGMERDAARVAMLKPRLPGQVGIASNLPAPAQTTARRTFAPSAVGRSVQASTLSSDKAPSKRSSAITKADATPPQVRSSEHSAPLSVVASGLPKKVAPVSFEAAVSHSVLPDAIPGHVVLHYAQDDAGAQSRARALHTALQSLGLEVKDVETTGAGRAGNSVIYFYNEDRSIADRVARQLDVQMPLQSRGSKRPVARPGTIEVSIGG